MSIYNLLRTPSFLVLFLLTQAQYIQSADKSIFRDCNKCPVMVEIPLGSVTVGAALKEEQEEGVPLDWQGNSTTKIYKVKHKFAVSQFPITVGEFALFADETKHQAKGCVSFNGKTWQRIKNAGWDAVSYSQASNHPVVCVSWHDAQAFTKWLSQKTGARYRLLRDKEWEYVARGGTETRRHWGDDLNHTQQCHYANGADKTYYTEVIRDGKINQYSKPNLQCDDKYAYTSPVGSFRPNQFGIYDIHGNVSEWVQDCFESPQTEFNKECRFRTLRGGSWADPTWSIRAADKYRDVPTNRCMSVGFRIARDMP